MVEGIMMMTAEEAGEEEDKQILKISCVFLSCGVKPAAFLLISVPTNAI